MLALPDSRPRVTIDAGVHSTAAEIPLDVTQQILGHASMATTTIYVQGDRKRRLREIGKLYREKR